MDHPLPVSATIEVAASPQAVWSVVSDVARMGEWSPECRKIFLCPSFPGFLGRSKAVGMGTAFLGVNKRGLAVWPTLSRIVRFEPERAVAWRTRESGATWTYELDPTVQGTLLTSRRDLTAFSPLTRLGAPLIGGAVGHEGELARGIRTTLGRIKAVVEAG